jgi:hypothetical protein
MEHKIKSLSIEFIFGFLQNNSSQSVAIGYLIENWCTDIYLQVTVTSPLNLKFIGFKINLLLK